ncbi:MAG: hypothetical protein DHS20C18_27160 [Saprospiraceae bacterium]|nr:MAG: hypothetical protein DHS20C18_27160 [Saprospiraceae bacterium]
MPALGPAQDFQLFADEDSPINQISFAGFYRGCAWVDIDNDHDLDLSFLGFLFRNDGDDQFSAVNSFGIPTDILGSVGWADYENDGDLDCLYGARSGTEIYQNDGTGNFTIVPVDPNDTLPTWSGQWGNYNNDPYPDVIVTVAFNFAGLTTPNSFYVGNADGTFTSVDTFDFVNQTAPYTVSYWTDFDEDGDSDLFIASGPGGGPGPDFIYRNDLIENGTPGLTRITDAPFTPNNQDGQCYNFIDYDLDGDLDLYLTNYSGAPNRFYENQNGTYTSITNELVFPGSNLANSWGDFDNDGYQDVLITADNLGVSGYYHNNGDGSFTRLSKPFQDNFVNSTQNISGVTIGDYDNDGDLDFFANGGGGTGARGLFKNLLDNDNHFVNFTLSGDPSNQAALGAIVKVKATINGQEVWLHREVSSQNSFMSQNSLRVHYGLGATSTIDSMTIAWPSGNFEVFTNIASDRFYSITEGTQTLVDLMLNTATENLEVQNQAWFDIAPNPVNNELKLHFKLAEAHDSVQLQLFSMDGALQLSKKVNVTPNQTISWDISRLAQGAYTLRATVDGKVSDQKVVVQR